ncbi:MAG: hypothetical protein V1779_01540 [bacterium]
MTNARILLFAVILNIALTSCQDPVTPPQNAVKLTVAELKNTVGYEWFNAYWTLYKPDTIITQEITAAFDTNVHKFVIFIEPSCSCRELVREPADLAKVLEIAMVNQEFYDIYSMGGVTSKHPFEDKLTITKLPQVHLLKSGEFVYSILDTFNYYSARDKSTKIESIILDALKNN